jgi:hypothetical protein
MILALVPESSSLDLDDCVPLTCIRGCGGHTVNDDDCEEESGRLGALSTASTSDISAKKKG